MVAPPGFARITVKTSANYDPTYLVITYDDIQGGLDIPLRLDSIGDHLYTNSIELKPSIPSKDESGNEHENDYPREYRLKKLEGFQNHCTPGWIDLENMTPDIWDRCVDRQYDQGYWWIHCYNGYSEIWLEDSPNYDLNYFRSAHRDHPHLLVWLNGSPDGPVQISIDTVLKVTKVTSSFQKVSDEFGVWRSVPELEGVEISLEDQEISLQDGTNPAIRLDQGPLKIRWKMDDLNRTIQPLSLHLEIFRPKMNGHTPMDSSGEYQYWDILPPQTTWNGGDWQEWILSPDQFTEVGSGRKLPPGFRSGNYLFKLTVTNFADNAIDQVLSFRVLGDPPELSLSKMEQKGVDGIEYSFDKKRLNSRFDLSVSTSSTGPFRLLTRNVIEDPPPKDPWSPYDVLPDERWEFISDESQEYEIDFARIKNSLQSRSVPDLIYFRFRSIDEVGNRFVSSPIPFQYKKSKEEGPKLFIEKMEGEEIPVLKGAVQDDSIWGTKNEVTLYLDKDGVAIASSTVIVPDHEPIFWSLSIPEKQSSLLQNGTYFLQLSAVDMDGYSRSVPVTLQFHSTPFDLKISNPLYTRSFPVEQDGGWVQFIDFKAAVQENSFLSLKIDDEFWFQNLFTGPQREILSRFYHAANLSEGKHQGLAILEKDGVQKRVSFDLVVDNEVPSIQKVQDLESKGVLLDSREIADNFLSQDQLTFSIDVASHTSPVTVRYAVSDSVDDINRTLSDGEGAIFVSSGTTIEIKENKTYYLGLLALDESGNSSSIELIPLYRDTQSPRLEISSIEQKGSDLQTFDRTHFWVYFSEGKTEPSPARYDCSVSTSEMGPYHLVTRSVLEDPPPKSPWIWNELLGESEWQVVKKLDGKIVPLSLELPQIKQALSLSQFPGEGSNATLYFRVRSIDSSGNEYRGIPKSFSILVDRKVPKILLSSTTFEILELGENGSLISGTIQDKLEDNASVKVQLFRGDQAISETWTSQKTNGEFGLSLPVSSFTALPNGHYDMEIGATDVDGNESRIPIDVSISIPPFRIEIPEILECHFNSNLNGEGGTLDLQFPVVPNSKISLKMDGFEILKEVSVGPTRIWKGTVPIPRSPSLKKVPALIQISKNGQTLSKMFELQFGNSSSDWDAPELTVSGDPGTISIFDVGSYGGLSGTVRSHGGSGDWTQILLSREGVILASAVVRSDGNYFVPWELIIPESARSLLGNGEKDWDLIAQDENGSRTVFPIHVAVDIRDLFLEIPNPILTRSDLVSDSRSKSSFLLKGKMKENSLLTLILDDKVWVQDFFTGYKKEFEQRFESQEDLVPGEHLAQITLKHQNQELTKTYRVVIENSPPKMGSVQEMETKHLLKSEGVNLFSQTHLKLHVPIQEPYIQETKYFLSSEIQEIFNRSDLSRSFHQEISLHLNGGTSTYLGIEAINQSGLMAQQIYFLQIDTVPPTVPTLQLVGRNQNEITFEGTASADSNNLLHLIDSRGKILSTSYLSFQPGDKTAVWSSKLENLDPGDYEVYAIVENGAGNRSPWIGPERFTIFPPSNLKPRWIDLSYGKNRYTTSKRPTLLGITGVSRSPVQVFETGNYLGATLSDNDGHFSFTPSGDLENGWKNFVAVVFDSNGQRWESEPYHLYLLRRDPSSIDPRIVPVLEDEWEVRFSPNGDGIHDFVQFQPEDVPVTIQQFRRGGIVKTVTEQDNYLWDGRSDSGTECETDLYLAKLKNGREITISLYR